ncbi:MAG TPA: leucyl aminopeptidase [Jiangellaceae bacterium]|nr:leucyl aminopeptidase [Jiangellaceae bacterium]
MTTITLSSADPTDLKVDAIVVGIAEGDGDDPTLLPGAEPVDAALDGSLAATLGSLGATGKADEVTKLPIAGAVKARIVVAVGLGKIPAAGPNAETVRRAAGAAARALKGTASAAFALPISGPAEAGAVAEGLLLGTYAFDQYKTGENGKAPLEAATVVGPGVRAKAAKQAVERAEIVADSVNQARNWINIPPRDLPPKDFADSAVKYAKGVKLDIEVLDEKALAKAGYGGTVGVGQGSSRPPRLVRMAYQPARANKHVAIIGKGITFDSGGLSLKPSDAMVTMKSDMSGAAAVLAAVVAIAKLAPKVAVTAYAPLAENMPSGTAQRPSDVLTIYGGKTVEVLNTDAEGRLILADALARASEDEPDLIVDVATLTGACVIALGTRVSGIMSNDDDVLERVHDASKRAGDQMWPLPLPEELREKLDSSVADIANIGERWGGALSAGVFLKEFVGDGIKWAHLDIAGPAYNDGSPYGYMPKGGTGAGVRTLVQIVEDVEAGRLP